MSIKRSPTMVIFGWPTVECNAGNCRFMLVISTTSPSTMVIFPTPALPINSAAKEPTPPTPTINTFDFFNFSKPSSLYKSSARSVHSAIFKNGIKVFCYNLLQSYNIYVLIFRCQIIYLLDSFFNCIGFKKKSIIRNCREYRF